MVAELRDPNPDDVAFDRVRVADLIDRVVVGLGGVEGDEVDTEFGVAVPTVVQFMIVFDKQGEIEQVIEDMLIFQMRLKRHFMNDRIVGRIVRDGNAYDLKEVGEAVKSRVSAALTEWEKKAVAAGGGSSASPRSASADEDGGYVNPAGRPNPRRPRPVVGDGADAF